MSHDCSLVLSWPTILVSEALSFEMSNCSMTNLLLVQTAVIVRCLLLGTTTLFWCCLFCWLCRKRALFHAFSSRPAPYTTYEAAHQTQLQRLRKSWIFFVFLRLALTLRVDQLWLTCGPEVEQLVVWLSLRLGTSSFLWVLSNLFVGGGTHFCTTNVFK